MENVKAGETEIEVEIADNGETAKENSSQNAGKAEPETAEVHEDGAGSAEETVKEEPKESESERYLRLAAEFDNYRKRTAREFGEIIKSANARLLKDLIEIKDNFERALEGQASPADIQAYRKGVELIYGQLTALLEKENVKPIEAVGKAFNPNLHEAMLQQESDEYDEGIVCQEIQKGYQLDGRVLRHARVIVSSGRKAGNEKDEQE